MRNIVILGPVTTKSYFGGVADFDEELAIGFRQIGYRCYVFTEQNDVKEDIEGVFFVKSFYAVCREIEKLSPLCVIASLGYGKYFACLPKNIIKIYVLHGFFNRSNYGIAKSLIASFYQKLITNKADYIIANSYFTKMINENFFNIMVDKVIRLGIAKEYIERLDAKEIYNKEKNSILFCGRLVKQKGVDIIVKSMINLKYSNWRYKLYIAGDGGERRKLEKIANDNNLNVEFLGRLNHKELYMYYQKSEVFISLNASEPMGITFMEAIANGCKIICPKTGGQIEVLLENKHKFIGVNENSPEEISEAIKRLTTDDLLPIYTDYHELGYNLIAQKMIDTIRA